jgi:hypothetical protein
MQLKRTKPVWRVCCCECGTNEQFTESPTTAAVKLYQSEASGLIWCKKCYGKINKED